MYNSGKQVTASDCEAFRTKKNLLGTIKLRFDVFHVT